MKGDYDYIFKIVLVGDSTVGKSSLIHQFNEHSFDRTTKNSLGVDFIIKSVTHNLMNIKLQIWDTAGQERFKSLYKSYYKGAHGIVVVYDCTNEESFLNTEFWFREVNNHGEVNANKILIGNKTDLKDSKKVTTQSAKDLANKLGVTFFETSAKDATNVEEAFMALVAEIVQRKVSMLSNKTEPTIKIDKTVNAEADSSCFGYFWS